MKKIISLQLSLLKAEFLYTYKDYNITKADLADTIGIIRTPSGKLSSAAFVGFNGAWTSVKASLHAQDEPFRNLDYNNLKNFLKSSCLFTDTNAIKVIRFLEKNNCEFIPIFEGEENPILIKTDLGTTFPFPKIKETLEKWLSNIPLIIQCEIRFKNKSYYAQENKYFVNPLILLSQQSNKRIDNIELIIMEKIETAQSLFAYDLQDYGIDTNENIYIPVLRSGKIEILETQIQKNSNQDSAIKYGSIADSVQLNYIVVEGDLRPGDSGAPAIIEKYGKLFFLGSVRSLNIDNKGIITIWNQAEEAALFGDSLNMIPDDSAHKNNTQVEYPLAEYYGYGAANTIPHIHCYSGGFHLKIVTSRNKIERIDIVKDGILKEENLKNTIENIEKSENSEFKIKHEDKIPLKSALLQQVKKYGFEYVEDRIDFKNLEEFRQFLKSINS